MAITLTNIPGIMRANRMPIGATVMESWFSRPVAAFPAYGTTDTSAVTMKWVLGFKRAQEVYDKLIKEKIWVNAAAQKEIKKMLTAKGLLGGATQNFGNLSSPAPTLDSDYINLREVGMSGSTENLDDLDAALGRFTFHVAIAGTVTPLPKSAGHQVEVKEVGIYVRDSYDFDGYQYLGCWNDTKSTVSKNPLASGDTVYNSDFRDWRAKNGRGGDYLIFSDVAKMTLTPADSFVIGPPSAPVVPRWEPGPKW
jgi:hypothetical protein